MTLLQHLEWKVPDQIKWYVACFKHETIRCYSIAIGIQLCTSLVFNSTIRISLQIIYLECNTTTTGRNDSSSSNSQVDNFETIFIIRPLIVPLFLNCNCWDEWRVLWVNVVSLHLRCHAIVVILNVVVCTFVIVIITSCDDVTEVQCAGWYLSSLINWSQQTRTNRNN